MAGRGVDIRLGGNPATEHESEEVKSLGGLFVLGTERHEARRIDNQLRGRAGRQGDPGQTQFYVSLEDSLLRVFASDVIKRVMGSFNIPEDEPIFNSMITRSLEKAQTRIEEIHCDSRKHVLADDDVLNIQRQSIYGRRRGLLTGGDAAIDGELGRLSLGDSEFESAIAAKRKELGDAFMPTVRRILLQGIDFLWVEHLEAMEYLRSSVNLRAYGQRDPLVEYKKEGLRLFQSLEESYASHVRTLVMNVALQPSSNPQSSRVQSVLVRTSAPQSKKEYERNDKVTITNGSETKEMKYKKAEPLLAQGWRIVS